jgi:hypothetical protein
MLGTATRNFVVAPFLYLIAMAATWFTLPGEVRTVNPANNQNRASLAETLRNYARQLTAGYHLVISHPILRTATIASAIFAAFMWLTFLLFAPLYANYAIFHADPTLLAPIKGLIIAMFGIGSLYGGKLTSMITRGLKQRFGEDKEALDEASRRSTIQWIAYGAIASLSLGAMAVPWPVIAPFLSSAAITTATAALGLSISPTAVVAGIIGFAATLAVRLPKVGFGILMAAVTLTFPSHVAIVSTAFLILGAVQGIAGNMKDSLFDTRVQELGEKKKQGDARAFVNASTVLAAAVLTVILKFITYGQLPFNIPSPIASFSGLPGIWPFVAFFGAVVIPATLLGIWVSRKLNTLTTPH